MSADKIFCLVTGELVWEQNPRCQAKPMVFALFELVHTMFTLHLLPFLCSAFLPVFELLITTLVFAETILYPWGVAAKKRLVKVWLAVRFLEVLLGTALLLWIVSLTVFQVGLIFKCYCLIQMCGFIKELFAVLPTYPRVFDSTLGYPGEGWRKHHSRRQKRRRRRKSWSKDYAHFTMATWNTRSMTRERFECCKSLGYDVLAVTEQWRTQNIHELLQRIHY